MKKYEIDKSFLARWAANELTNEELAEFKKTDAYKDFKLINAISQNFKGPIIDKNAALIKTKAKIAKEKGKVKKLNPSLWYSIAASILLVLGLFYGLNTTKTYETSIGEQLAISLPDGSTVKLNANSKMSHKRFFWKNNRSLNLKGEAYFEVQKGSDFKVTTSYGNVTVLGTKFNIKTREHIFELNCFEGAVRFDQKETNAHKTLHQNDQIIISNGAIKDTKITLTTPSWINGLSIFENRPLKEVLNELSSYYAITFNTENIDDTKLFSGSFVHNDLEKALRATLTPMGIVYNFSKEKTVIHLQ